MQEKKERNLPALCNSRPVARATLGGHEARVAACAGHPANSKRVASETREGPGNARSFRLLLIDLIYIYRGSPKSAAQLARFGRDRC